MMDTFMELKNFIDSHPVINTHSHHLPDHSFQKFSLESILRQSYVGWLEVPFGTTYEERRNYLDKVQSNSYFVWLQKGIRDLYRINEPLSPDSWDMYSQRISEAHMDPDNHLAILRQKCRYDSIVLDTYWEPGSNNGHPDLFTPTFRINMFLFGYSINARDHNGNNPYLVYNKQFTDIDEYISFVRGCIISCYQVCLVPLQLPLAG